MEITKQLDEIVKDNTISPSKKSRILSTLLSSASTSQFPTKYKRSASYSMVIKPGVSPKKNPKKLKNNKSLALLTASAGTMKSLKKPSKSFLELKSILKANGLPSNFPTFNSMISNDSFTHSTSKLLRNVQKMPIKIFNGDLGPITPDKTYSLNIKKQHGIFFSVGAPDNDLTYRFTFKKSEEKEFVISFSNISKRPSKDDSFFYFSSPAEIILSKLLLRKHQLKDVIRLYCSIYSDDDFKLTMHCNAAHQKKPDYKTKPVSDNFSTKIRVHLFGLTPESEVQRRMLMIKEALAEQHENLSFVKSNKLSVHSQTSTAKKERVSRILRENNERESLVKVRKAYISNAKRERAKLLVKRFSMKKEMELLAIEALHDNEKLQEFYQDWTTILAFTKLFSTLSKILRVWAFLINSSLMRSLRKNESE